jgi:hypothetical protein
MATIIDVIKHAVCMQSEQIRQIKSAALKIKPAKMTVYVSPDGKTTQTGRPRVEEYAAGWRMTQVEYDRVIEHISPRHSQWPRYQAARRQASLLLTARLLLKLGGESVPELPIVRRALQEGRLSRHASGKRARSLSFAAWRYLRKLDNRLQRRPEKFSAVDSWANGATSGGNQFSAPEAATT